MGINGKKQKSAFPLPSLTTTTTKPWIEKGGKLQEHVHEIGGIKDYTHHQSPRDCGLCLSKKSPPTPPPPSLPCPRKRPLQSCPFAHASHYVQNRPLTIINPVPSPPHHIHSYSSPRTLASYLHRWWLPRPRGLRASTLSALTFLITCERCRMDPLGNLPDSQQQRQQPSPLHGCSQHHHHRQLKSRCCRPSACSPRVVTHYPVRQHRSPASSSRRCWRCCSHLAAY